MADALETYIVVEREPALDEDTAAWLAWMCSNDTRVDRYIAGVQIDGVFADQIIIETVFAGYDRNALKGQSLKLFQTKISGDVLDGERERSATWADAVAVHNRAVKVVQLDGTSRPRHHDRLPWPDEIKVNLVGDPRSAAHGPKGRA